MELNDTLERSPKRMRTESSDISNNSSGDSALPSNSGVDQAVTDESHGLGSQDAESISAEQSVGNGSESAPSDAGPTYSLELLFDKPPSPIAYCDEFMQSLSALENNFTKGVKWSPDGTCLISNSDDNKLRLFEFSPELMQFNADEPKEATQLKSLCTIGEGEPIYDFCRYPKMSSYDPTTCIFLSSSRDHPVHMWDAYTGKMRCSYRAYDQMDEITAAYSISFDLDGQRIYCGYNNMMRIFDTSNPGRDFTQLSCKRKDGSAQTGIISCFAFNPDYSGLFANGSYSNVIGLYNQAEQNAAISVMQPETGTGITQLRFSPDGNYLYSASRKSHFIYCWDIRNTGKVLFQMQRDSDTNQHVGFDIDAGGRYLVSGSLDGNMSVYDLAEAGNIVSTTERHRDAVNWTNFHPSLAVVACCTGQRHFNIDVRDEEETVKIPERYDSRIVIWGFHHRWNQNQ